MLVAGAGAAGMTAALVARCEGLDVLLCEKSPQVGGTTATQPARIWVPARERRDKPDSPTTSPKRAALSRFADWAAHGRRREAYLRRPVPSSSTISTARSDVKFSPLRRHPDYRRTVPGDRWPAGRWRRCRLTAAARRGFRARSAADRRVHGAWRHDGRPRRHRAVGAAVRVVRRNFARGALLSRYGRRPPALSPRHTPPVGQRAGRETLL